MVDDVDVMSRIRPMVTALLGLAMLAGGCVDATSATDRTSTQSGSVVAEATAELASGGAVDALSRLPVKGRAPKTGYDRDRFGSPWTDDVTVTLGRNGCDTRNDILRRDLDAVTVEPGTNGCVVLEGTLTDPYSARVMAFERGAATSSDVQIDHVVPLSLAWQTGAQQLDEPTRRDFANDPLNLVAVDGTLNQQKSDSDAASWLPPDKSYRCDYVTRMVAVKTRYSLWVTPPERDAVIRVLTTCPAQSLSDEQPERPTSPSAELPYDSCSAARAAGAAPVYRGDPGYRSELDGDDDGVGCE